MWPDDSSALDDALEAIRRDLADSYEEEMELGLEEARLDRLATDAAGTPRTTWTARSISASCCACSTSWSSLQDWVPDSKLRVVVLFEGRDSAGKGGVIKRITQRLNPRVCRVAALPAPSERERTQWYFQRYVAHLPAGGEIVLFDRSWYNRAGVERVMGFCTEADVEEFFRSVPEFERMLVRSGIVLLKYWFSITDEEQASASTCASPTRSSSGSSSPMDVEVPPALGGLHRAKEDMLARTHIAEAPWWVVEAVDKKRARLNCISHLLAQIPYGRWSIPRSTCPTASGTRITCGGRFPPRCTSRPLTDGSREPVAEKPL